jgi:hypothetical protein
MSTRSVTAMSTRSTEIMARLGAADPARCVVLDATERDRLWQLLAAAADDGDDDARQRAGRSRLRRLTLAIPAALILAAGTLAASGVIRAPAPAEPVTGASALPRRAELAKGPVRFLALTAPDPGGDLSNEAPGPGRLWPAGLQVSSERGESR